MVLGLELICSLVVLQPGKPPQSVSSGHEQSWNKSQVLQAEKKEREQITDSLKFVCATRWQKPWHNSYPQVCDAKLGYTAAQTAHSAKIRCLIVPHQGERGKYDVSWATSQPRWPQWSRVSQIGRCKHEIRCKSVSNVIVKQLRCLCAEITGEQYEYYYIIKDRKYVYSDAKGTKRMKTPRRL